MSAGLALAAVGSLLAGDWAYVPALSDTAAAFEACETDNGIRYAANGSFSTFDGTVRGTWQLTGRTLTEQVTHEREPGERERRIKQRPTTATLRWLSPNHLNLTVAPGKVQGLLRCRAAR